MPTESLSNFHFLEPTKVYAHGRRLSRKVALAVVILYGNIDSTLESVGERLEPLTRLMVGRVGFEPT